MLNNVQKAILTSVVRSDCISDLSKLNVFSYLFYQLCWDFPFHEIYEDIETGVVDYQSYDFENI